MLNQSNITGNHNILIQGVSNSTITLNVDGELQEIRNDLAALQAFLEKMQTSYFQADKLYNIGEIGQANFQTIIQQAPFLPSKELTLPPFYPEVFLGREDDLKAIHHQLFNENKLLLLVNGEGGIGKTTLAARYFFTYKQNYQHVAWVFAERSLLDALLTLALPLGVDFPPAMPNPERLTLLLRKMASLQRPCLLIIDNANLLEDLERYYPQLTTCRNFHLLLTTRITQFEQAKTYVLQPLPQDQAIALFQQYYKTEATELLLQILPAVGYNTLVIELLAKNLANFNRLKSRYSLSDLLQDLQQKGLLALQNKEVNTLYHADGALRKATPEAILSAMYDLNELTEAENQLLSIFAVLPAENILFEILENLLPNTQYLDDTLLALAQRGWLDYNEADASFKCSPVIQEITRHKNQEHLLEHCETLIYNLNEKLAYDSVHISGSATYEEAALYARYGESVVNNIEYINNRIGVLCERLGNYHTTVGNLDNALAWFEQYRDCEQALSNAYPNDEKYKNNLAISYEKLGVTQSSLGNLEQALRFFEEETQLFEELYEAYPSNVGFKNGLAISYSKLGDTQSNLGNLEQALRFFEDYNRLKKELYEAYPSNVSFKNGLAISYEKLGDTQSSLGNLEQALRFFEEETQLFEELYEAYPSNVGFKNGLAISYQYLGITNSSLGNLEQSLPFFEDYYRLIKGLHEEYSNNVAFKLNFGWANQFLGITYTSFGDLNKALIFFEGMQKLFEGLYAAYPTNVGFKNGLAISYEKLGETQSSLGNLEQALRFFEEETQLFEELYEAYPSNVDFKNGLAISYSKLGSFYQYQKEDKAKAAAYFQQCHTLWQELVQAFPAYVEFKRNLDWVEAQLAEG